MVNLLKDAPYPYIRLSGLAGCDLVMAHNIIGTPEMRRGTKDASGLIPMWKGSALEEMVNQFLRYHGMMLYFTGDNQLELNAPTPARRGHNDGLIAAGENGVSEWMTRNLPTEALRRLNDGELLCNEVKTANDATFRQIVAGGLESGAYTKKYLDQQYGYLGILGTDEFDHLWLGHETDKDIHGHKLPDGMHRYQPGSNDYAEMLARHHYARPTASLVTIFNTMTNKWAFELIPFDHGRLATRLAGVEVFIFQELRAGRMPDPSFDGTAPDCYHCAFAHLCPAVEARRTKEFEENNILDLDIQSPAQLDLDALENLAAAYAETASEIKSLGIDQAERKTIIEAMIQQQNTVVTPRYVIGSSYVNGRRSVDMDVVKKFHAWVRDEYPDIYLRYFPDATQELPVKTGRGYSRLRITPLYGPSFDGEV